MLKTVEQMRATVGGKIANCKSRREFPHQPTFWCVVVMLAALWRSSKPSGPRFAVILRPENGPV